MSTPRQAFTGADIFDGHALLHDHALIVSHGVIEAVLPAKSIATTTQHIALAGGVLAPGFVDLQVNGGGGLMFNDAPGVATLKTIAAAHGRLGTAALLPTLITDTPARTAAAIAAAIAAIAKGVGGIAGLHLEGPHLSHRRKGAHNAALIRPMSATDLAILCQAAARLPVLMLTVAPENTTLAQVRQLVSAGALVALGHSDADYETCMAYAKAGARIVTHLFNAMSQLQNRKPGLVGAALDCGGLSAGLIADGVHVHPATMAAALRAKRGPGQIFLVTDAMAPAGTDLTQFTLNGQIVTRNNKRLTLPDGTLAGADLKMTDALHRLVKTLGVSVETALAMATSRPATLAGLAKTHGFLRQGRPASFVHLTADMSLQSRWENGTKQPLA